VLRLCAAWQAGDVAAARRLDEWLLASRESAELRAEAAQMGYSLAQLLTALGEPHDFEAFDEVCWHTAYAYAAVRWNIAPAQALAALLWAWAENQVVAAVKAVPLGQSAGQRMLFALGPRLAAAAERAARLPDDDIGNMAPGLARLSAQHETQYSRLFRS
jgi:urease accessory protein